MNIVLKMYITKEYKELVAIDISVQEKEAAVACTKQLNSTITMVVVVVIITDKKLMFSLHSQLASDEYPIQGYGNEDPRMLGSPYPRE